MNIVTDKVGIPGNDGRLGNENVGIAGSGIAGIGMNIVTDRVGIPGNAGRLGNENVGIAGSGIVGIGINIVIDNDGNAQFDMYIVQWPRYAGLKNNRGHGGDATPANNGTPVRGEPINTVPFSVIVPAEMATSLSFICTYD
jgi:hypothetical protein